MTRPAPGDIRTKPVRSGPPHFSRAMGKIVADLAKKTNALDPRLAASWAEIAGPDLARICRPVQLKTHGRAQALELAVPNGAAAMQVQFKQKFILDKVNIVLGHKRVTRLVIRQTGKNALETKQKNPWSQPEADMSPHVQPLPSPDLNSGKLALASALDRLQNLVTKTGKPPENR